jgi:hypothetical protein
MQQRRRPKTGIFPLALSLRWSPSTARVSALTRGDRSTMIWNLNIKLLPHWRADGPWEATIAVDASWTLEWLHHAIQRAVAFDNDHLYELFIARTPRSRERIRFDDEDGGLYEHSIESLFPLPTDRRLYYLFDYGDHWVFQISRTRHQPYEPEPGVEYPVVLSERGQRPEQYPMIED